MYLRSYLFIYVTNLTSMKCCSFLLLGLIIIFSCNAQSTAPISEYFDKDWKTITDPSKASYYRTIEQNNRGFLVRDYYISGKIQMVAECEQVSPELYREGNRVLYYENGNIKEEGQYHLNDRIGLHKWYYENGKPKKEVLYEGEKARYNHYWSETGEDALADGEGEIKDNSNGDYDLYQSIRNFVVVDTYNIRRSRGDTLYMVVEHPPEYPGGYEQMITDIKSNMVYPKSARKGHVTGTVYVGFVVGKDGVARDHEVIRGIHSECDAAALQAVTKLKNWKPGMQKTKAPGSRLKAVSVRFVVPIKFSIY